MWHLLLVSFILGDSNWIFFPSQLPYGQPYKFCFEANTIWYSAMHKVYEIALSKVLATQMGVTEVQHQSQLI